MENNYKRIARVTTEIMSEKGYHGTSIQAIADKVGITKSTIFHYYKSKEGILLSILEDYVPSATNDMMLICKNKNIDGIEKLRKFLHAHLNLVVESGDILNLYLRESRHLTDHNVRVYRQSQRVYVGLVAEIIRQIQMENKELFKDIDPKIAALAIFGMCNWAVHWYDRDGECKLKDLEDYFFRILTGGLTRSAHPLKSRKGRKV